MRVILAATDLTARSDRALHRAAILAKEFEARLEIIHVIDGSRSQSMAGGPPPDPGPRLRAHARRLGALTGTKPDVLLQKGKLAETIAAAARDRDADLIVMGAPQRKSFREALVGSAVERVMRTAPCPVLMVRALPVASYRRVLLASDMSPAAASAGRTARALGFLHGAELSVVHAFWPYATGVLRYVGAGKDVISRHVADETLAAGRELNAFLKTEGFADADYAVSLHDGDPLDAIIEAIAVREAELLVIATRDEAGLKRVLVGSLTGDIVNEVDCDILAVPAGIRMPAGMPTTAEIRTVGTG